MILSPHWYTRTTLAGLLSFGIAAVSGYTTWFRVRNVPAVARLAAWITILESLLFFDVAFNGRWILHGKIMQIALHQGLYERRRGMQIAGLAIVLAILLSVMVIKTSALRGRRGAIMAACGALLSLALWCVEVISLHEFDAVLYRKVGGFMVIAFIWIVLCATTAISLQSEGRAAK